MARISNAKKARQNNARNARLVNPLQPRQLRPRKRFKKVNRFKKHVRRQHKVFGEQSQDSKPFDQQKHLKECRKIAVEKLHKKRFDKAAKTKLLLLGRKAAAWNRRSSSIDKHTQPSTSRQINPETVLATKRQSRLSNEGYRRVNNLVSRKFEAPLMPTGKIQKARRELENFIKYTATKQEDIRLESVVETVQERQKRLGLDDNRGRQLLFSLDKGRGRVTSTVAFIHHPRPCSCNNHLPLQVWKGADNYDALQEHEIWKPVESLINAGYVFFHGGDLSYLSTAYGLSCSMTFPCLWCAKRFVRSASADKDSIDFTIYQDRSDPAVEDDIKAFKFAPPKRPIVPIDRNFVVPPVLHFKIKVGNELFSRLLQIAGKSSAFKSVIKEKHLDVDRHAEGVIYSRLNGNDVKRLCTVTEDLASVSNDDDYQRVIHVLRVFGLWCRLVSSTDTELSDKRIQEISCFDLHQENGMCCQTAAMGKALESIGGFGSSGLVYVIVMHLGPFLWRHRLIGPLVEEGIESVHWKLSAELQRHKKNIFERIQNALKWLAIDVLLSDKNLFEC